MAAAFSNEDGTFGSLDEDSLNDIFEQRYLRRHCFDRINKAVNILQRVHKIGYTAVYRRRLRDNDLAIVYLVR